jgi:hypothetical protein
MVERVGDELADGQNGRVDQVTAQAQRRHRGLEEGAADRSAARVGRKPPRARTAHGDIHDATDRLTPRPHDLHHLNHSPG